MHRGWGPTFFMGKHIENGVFGRPDILRVILKSP
jgi:hypothetical protein